MINPALVRTFEYVVDTSQVAEILNGPCTKQKRGRPRKWDAGRIYWIGAFLAARTRGSVNTTVIYQVLTEDIDIEDQIRLGYVRKSGDSIEVMPISALENVLKRYRLHLEFGAGSNVDANERAKRDDIVYQAIQSTIDIFIRPFEPECYAIDATGQWAWAKGTGAPKGSIADDEELTPTRPASSEDQDATWGRKTSKSGKRESFFGYEEHTAVIVRDTSQREDDVPALVAGFVLVPAATDVVDPTLTILDRLAFAAKAILVDRHYSYKAYGRWLTQLMKRGIVQHRDYRGGEFKHTDINGMIYSVGFLHCPAMPQELWAAGPVPRKRPKGKDEFIQEHEYAEEDYDDKRAAYDARTKLRYSYVMPYKTRPDATGKCRVQCPARYGSLGCPRVEGSVAIAVEMGLPIVLNPPAKGSPQDLATCNQTTVTVNLEHRAKDTQPFYYGLKGWILSYNRRTYVEGNYGNRKNDNTENMTRGHRKVTGITMNTLLSLPAIVSSNHRLLTYWYNRNKDNARLADVIAAIPDELIAPAVEDLVPTLVKRTEARRMYFPEDDDQTDTHINFVATAATEPDSTNGNGAGHAPSRVGARDAVPKRTGAPQRLNKSR